MILLDGKKLAGEILEDLKAKFASIKSKPRLAVVLVGNNPASKKFVEQKKKAAENIGAGFRIYSFEEDITTNELRKRLAGIIHEKNNTGVIVQLPLPKHVNTQYILNSIMPEKDVDLLSAKAMGDFIAGQSLILPPVVGAIKELLEKYKIDLKGKNIVLVGAGHLVGKPLAIWLTNQKIGFSLVEEKTASPESFIKNADILISGVGKPEFIKGDWLKNGVVVVDAGTSESGGRLVGDIELESASKKASYLAPVPGGVGPLTVAILFKNLFILSSHK